MKPHINSKIRSLQQSGQENDNKSSTSWEQKENTARESPKHAASAASQKGSRAANRKPIGDCVFVFSMRCRGTKLLQYEKKGACHC